MFWDYFSLWDTLCLNLDIGSRVYDLSPSETFEAGEDVAFGVSFGFSTLGAYFAASLTGWFSATGFGV